MKILLLEDRGSVSVPMQTALESKGHTVLNAIDVYDAQSYWESDNIECLIIDSNMGSEGLTEDQIIKTKGGILTGWIWLRDSVFTKRPDMRERTIIYTEYMDWLLAEAAKDELEGIYLVRKRAASSSAKQVLSIIENFAKKPAGK